MIKTIKDLFQSMKPLKTFYLENELQYSFYMFIRELNLDIKKLSIDECLNLQEDFIKIYRYDLRDLLYETLKTSYTYSGLIANIENSFKYNIEVYAENIGLKKVIRCKGSKDSLESDKFKRIIRSYNYEITNKKIGDYHDIYTLEPIEIIEQSDLVYDKNNEIVYLLTTKAKYKQIKKEGIVPFSKYSRISKTYISTNYNSIDLEKFSLMISNAKGYQKKEKFILLTIKIPKDHKLKFFTDKTNKYKDVFWTMEYIPSKWIINFDNIEIDTTLLN